MQLVLLCVLVPSLLQPGLLEGTRTEDITTNGDGGDLSQSIRELKNIILDISVEVRCQLATINSTVNSLQGQLESLTGEVGRNRERINSVNKRVKTVESGQADSQNTSLQLVTATAQLSNGLDQLRRELATNQQTINLAHNRTQEQLEELSLSLQQQCRQSSLEALQDSLAAHTRQLATATDQLSTGHQALEDGLTEQLQTLTSDCDNTTAELLQGQRNVIETLHGIDERVPYTCGGSPGWRRVAFLNMTDPSQDCPSGWRLTTHSVRTCGRASRSEYGICDPVTFPVSGAYSRVCGRITAYQYGRAYAFRGSYGGRRSLDGSYVDGISITHGVPRQHIWTFAAGLGQEHQGDDLSYDSTYQYCYCDVQTHRDGYKAIPQSFVGDDYFCEAAVANYMNVPNQFHSENPLWDGEGCGQNSTCCSMNNPPYFMKDLPAPTTDDIEARLCFYNAFPYCDFRVELLEIYVQ